MKSHERSATDGPRAERGAEPARSPRGTTPRSSEDPAPANRPNRPEAAEPGAPSGRRDSREVERTTAEPELVPADAALESPTSEDLAPLAPNTLVTPDAREGRATATVAVPSAPIAARGAATVSANGSSAELAAATSTAPEGATGGSVLPAAQTVQAALKETAVDGQTGPRVGAEGDARALAPQVAPQSADAPRFAVEAPPETPARPLDVETADSVLRQFKLSIKPNTDRALIQLHPAELGRISVRLELERGRLKAVLRADRPETLELLERHVPELRAALESKGVATESFDFGLGLDHHEHTSERDADGGDRRASGAAAHPAAQELVRDVLLERRIVSDIRVDTLA